MNEFLDRLFRAGASRPLVAYVEHELAHRKLELVNDRTLVSDERGIVLVIGSNDEIDADPEYFFGI
jgi:hypothetical protein